MKTNQLASILAVLLVSGALCHAVDRYVSLAGGHVPPFTNWLEAATNIQDAIDAASAGDVIWVTNGIYATGGKLMAGDLTNRVALDKALTVRSVNGPLVTMIQGDGTFNGLTGVRCAWLTNGAMLSGFTLTSGATRPVGDMATLQSGGGAWCSSTNAELANCVITNCRARGGGGVYRGALNQCTLVGNAASQYGGGAYDGLLFNCLVTGNESGGLGGGVYGGWLYNCALIENSARAYGGGGHSISFLVNCTVTRNTAGSISGGISWSALTNCIAYFNSAPASANLFGITAAAYVCSSPLRSGPGNTSDDPQLVDGFHLAVTSPCRGMGSSLVAIGADIDGEAWASPPSMGCDEVWESGLTGPLSVSLTAAYPEVAAYGAMPLTGEISGSATRLEWSFGDGPTYTNLSCFTLHTWANSGDYTVTFTAFNADNPGGVSTNLLVHVVPLVSPPLSVAGNTETHFSLSFPGQPGVSYVVEQTTNLVPPVTWQTVQTLTSTGEVMQVTHTKGTNEMRFYRARTL